MEDIKFKIIPSDSYEIFTFSKENKKINIRVYWGSYSWPVFSKYDFKEFENCKDIDEIQNIVNEKIINVIEIKDLSKALGADLEVFNNEESGGGASASIEEYINVGENELSELIDGNVTLREAAENWQDELLVDNGWSNTEICRYFATPVKIQEIKEEKKEFTDYEKITNKVGIKHLTLLDNISNCLFKRTRKKKENLIKDIKEKYTSEDLELLLQYVEKANEKMDKNTPIEEKYDKQISFIKGLI